MGKRGGKAQTVGDRRCEPEQAREYLDGLKRALETELETFGVVPPATRNRVEFCIWALGRFLSGEVKSLDKAFCLKRGKGQPKKEQEYELLARMIYDLLGQGLKWEEIMGKLSDLGEISEHGDDSTPRRAFKRYKTKLLAEELTKRLDQIAKDD